MKKYEVQLEDCSYVYIEADWVKVSGSFIVFYVDTNTDNGIKEIFYAPIRVSLIGGI